MYLVLEEISLEVQYLTDAFYLQDGNSMFHSLTALPQTFGEIALKILDSMVAKKAFLFLQIVIMTRLSRALNA